ncbi:hypothetical protein PanWU01x14_240700 [Parasponia andersonii]|uniref:Uncharacterized protein n=1 Tax=Parasponia andersonii TaxID=3476 RepID=A0A2P5BGQ5_PARAD|nr:hypothetical protein PanWU01x14_240700 [Parasponia andersonii]
MLRLLKTTLSVAPRETTVTEIARIEKQVKLARDAYMELVTLDKEAEKGNRDATAAQSLDYELILSKAAG